ncbi:MAG: UPF0262 family protein [Proteobacteria bacterium]|nr:UPF0262 family protein [Pseudomonadota bacterium]MBW3617684.1 UPF0262 family protein [Pseudomonadota bacterium]
MSEARLAAVVIDAASLAPGGPEVEQEREIAIADLLEANSFAPAGGEGGPYRLRIAREDNRLVLEVSGPGYNRAHGLSLTPFRGVIRDYFMVCDSYFDAVRGSSPQQIEALDMGRRGLHNEGSELLRERLAGKIDTDHDTARRLFTLICALHRRAPQ